VLSAVFLYRTERRDAEKEFMVLFPVFHVLAEWERESFERIFFWFFCTKGPRRKSHREREFESLLHFVHKEKWEERSMHAFSL